METAWDSQGYYYRVTQEALEPYISTGRQLGSALQQKLINRDIVIEIYSSIEVAANTGLALDDGDGQSDDDDSSDSETKRKVRILLEEKRERNTLKAGKNSILKTLGLRLWNCRLLV